METHCFIPGIIACLAPHARVQKEVVVPTSSRLVILQLYMPVKMPHLSFNLHMPIVFLALLELRPEQALASKKGKGSKIP